MNRCGIDWPAASKTAADGKERAFLDALRALDALRRAPWPRTPPRPADPRVVPLRLVTAVASAQVVCVAALVALALARGAPGLPGEPARIGLAAAFPLACLLLAPASRRDDRAFLLLATFVFVASAFTRPLLTAHPSGERILSTVLFHGVYPEVFASAALWELAVVFPSVSRFGVVDVLARRAAACAWLVAGAIAGVNLLLAYGVSASALSVVARDDGGNLYWRLFAAATLPAIVLILVRAHRASRPERLKVLRFACALAAGAGPFLVLGTARWLPPVEAWLHTTPVRVWLDASVLTSLAALPLMTSIAVLLDRPFETRMASVRRRVPGCRPFGPLASVLSGPRRRMHEVLCSALDQLRLARGRRELLAVLRSELPRGLGSSRVLVLGPDELPPGAAIATLLAQGGGGPLHLTPDGEVFQLLPRAERDWLAERGTTLAAAVRPRDGVIAAIVLAGDTRNAGFSRAERWFITTLVLAAAAAWPQPAADDEPGEEPADECAGCGAVRPWSGSGCCGGAETTLAALPLKVGGKYRVVRRAGAGGMGVVYLARDETLEREVALKTLPALSDDAVPRLRAEARAMAGLNHPAVATIYGVEVWRGTPVLVLEYFPRGTLADALARGVLPVEAVVRLGIRLTDALAYVHARGMLHRDVKPGNIGFTRDFSAKLMDFGLTSAEEPAAGTRAYLPPEVLAGARPDRTSDLWALAIVLREACGGDPRLEPVLRPALAPRRHERFRSAREMHEALERLIGRNLHS